MQTQTSSLASSDYSAEIRFGVVMYGGVSLAIYINGVANEMFEMACATPRRGVTLDRAGESSSRDVYRRLSWLAASPELRAAYAARIRAAGQAARATAPAADPPDAWDPADTAGCTQTRLVIDVISGTSAGGINGVFLAKALANGERFGALKELWVNEGDIGLLLNDKHSYASVVPPLTNRSARPTSLLNSDRMYAKLLQAMRAMRPLAIAGRPDGDRGSPLVDEIDLFVTTTDIEGSAVALRLFDKVVYERRYKQSYRFGYPNGITGAGNDFEPANAAFLAFAARCTSSFPFAFEPMTLDAVARLRPDGEVPDLARWKAFFRGLPRHELDQDAHRHRAFGDGGYLDNKPFTYVVDALSQRFSSVPLERKLVFVEPSPERIDPHRVPDKDQVPDALENSIAALSTIPRYETIREDLQSVLQRNRRIERVERLVLLGEADIEKHAEAPFSRVVARDGQIPVWSSLRLSQMVAYYGAAFLPYQRLRVFSATDSLADRLGARWDIDQDSDQQYALRALVRIWRERRFDDEGTPGHETINAFLDQFDLDYRLRRLGFQLRKIDQLTRLLRKRCAGRIDPAALAVAEQQLAAGLPAPYADRLDATSDEQLRTGLDALRLLKDGLIAARDAFLQARRDGERAAAPGRDELRKALKAVLLLILGQAPEDYTAPDDDAAAVVAALPPRFIEAVSRPEARRLASVSRTLQEGVALRAAALFEAADAEGPTALQRALEADIDAMRVKRGRGEAQPSEVPLDRISKRAWALLGRPRLALDGDARVDVAVGDAEDGSGRLGAADLACLDSDGGRALRLFLGGYYLRFDSFDQVSFPLYYGTGTGEPSTVEAVRISPIDATHLIDEASDALHRRKLAGTALANFGAFLDRRWRLNDIMWGRLDGAERLIQAVLPMADDDTRTVRDELIERAQRGILREALVPEGSEELADLVVKALDGLPATPTTGEGIRTLLGQLWSGDSVARDRLGGVLASLLDERGLAEYVRTRRTVDPDPDPKATLDSAARAVAIGGRVLEGVTARHGAGSLAPRWLARLGLLLQGIVAVSLPGTLKHRWLTHGLKVLYAFELFLLAAALLFGGPDTRTLALSALGVTFGVQLLTWIAGDAMRQRRRWLHVAAAGVLAALLALAAVGALVLGSQTVQQGLCWSRPGAVAGDGLPASLCRWLGEGRAPLAARP